MFLETLAANTSIPEQYEDNVARHYPNNNLAHFVGLFIALASADAAQQTQGVESMLVSRWSTVYDVGPM